MSTLPQGVTVIDQSAPPTSVATPTPIPQQQTSGLPQQQPSFEEGGPVESGGFFKNFNYVEAGLLILATITLLSVIHYTRYMAKNAATTLAAQDIKLKNLEATVEGIKKQKTEQKFAWN